MEAFFQALHDRRLRAVTVAETYNIEAVGCQCWVVQHPDEPERCYLVDMIQHHCSCPDFVCTANRLGIDCKHILAVYPLWETATGLSKPEWTHPPIEVIYDRKRGEFVLIGELTDKTTNAQLRWLGGEAKRGEWRVKGTDRNALYLTTLFPSIKAGDRDFWRYVRAEEDRIARGTHDPLGPLGFSLSPLEAHRAKPVTEDEILAWRDGKMVLAWFKRENAA